MARMVAAPSSIVSSLAAADEQPVGEDVAALEIGGELDLVDGEERDLDIGRHRLDGADPEARVGGDDLFLAGDQRHGGSPTRARTRS